MRVWEVEKESVSGEVRVREVERETDREGRRIKKNRCEKGGRKWLVKLGRTSKE